MFNPVFTFLVLLGAVLLWFLSAFAFIPLGGLIMKIILNATDTMAKEDKKEEEEKEIKE